MKQEKIKFITRSIVFTIIFLMGMISYYLICNYYSETKNHLVWVNNAYQIKNKAAKNIKNNKLLILSGSNGHFGISAEKLSKLLNISAVNYGIHGDLKTYHFESAKKILKEGDIVFMPLEYELYWHNDKILFDQQPLYVKYILTYDKQYFSNLNLIRKINYTLIRLNDLIFNIYLTPKEHYNADTINEYGDETFYGNPKSLPNIIPIKLPDNYNINNYDGPKDILNFVNWCKTNNVNVVAGFPTLTKLPIFDDAKYIEFFNEISDFYKENSIEILGKPKDFMYEKKYYYDTHYHLNKNGKEINTELLIPKLEKITELR